MRNGRIICHALILKILQRRPHELNPMAVGSQRKESHAIMRQAQTEILATVPQHVGYMSLNPFECNSLTPGDLFSSTGSLPTPSMDMLRVVGLARPDLPVLRTSCGYLLLWALALAGKVADVGSNLRNSVCNMLDHAGRVICMSQAFIFSSALRENRPACSVVDDPTLGILAGPNMNNAVMPTAPYCSEWS